MHQGCASVPTVSEPAPTAPGGSTAELLPKGRLEAFADGVLAIVITLMVLELEVPGTSDQGDLLGALAEEWRSFLAYLISFVFVGGIWISHSNATRLLAHGDAVLFRLNLVVLFCVSLLPFTTSVMATHLGGDGGDVAVALYGINLLVASLVLNAFIGYAARRPELVADEIVDSELTAIERGRRRLVGGQAIAAAVAIFLPGIAVAAYLLISLGFVVMPLVAARRARR